MLDKRFDHRNRKILLGMSALLLTGTVLSGPVLKNAFAETTHPQTIASSQRNMGFADVVEKVRPAVVSIMVEDSAANESQQFSFRGQEMPNDERLKEFFEKFGLPKDFGKQFGSPKGYSVSTPRTAKNGSGFFVSEDGFIVTNNHVIKNADKITVRLQDGRMMNAALVGTDAKTDLAVLKVEGEGYSYVSFGDSNKIRTGDWVLTVGNPFGLSGTTTAGIVSTLGRDLGSDPYGDYIQIDAPINHGNSGGPAFNTDGEVIGVNTLIYSPSGGNVGIGFAIASNTAKKVVDGLMTDGKIARGWLGVMIQPVTDDMAPSLELEKAEGALIASVSDDSPAQNGELKPGDVIMRADGEPIKTVRDLTRHIADKKPATMVSLEIWRKGGMIKKNIKLSVQPDQQTAKLDSGKVSKGKLGLALEDSDKGVVVAEVLPDSPAAEKGITKGDIIARVDQQDVKSAKDVKDAITKAKSKGKNRILMLVKSDNGNRFVVLDMSRA